MNLFEAEITPGMSPGEVVELARLVEQAGFDRLGISDVVFWPDCLMLQALCAAATERVQIGSMVTNPYSRHPVVLAGALATLQEISGGRAFCGIGVGAGLEPIGIDYPRPVLALRETIGVLRALLAGEEVTFRGETVEVSASRLVRPVPDAPVPIAVGTRSKQVMMLAGELADTALVGARYLSAEQAATYRQWLGAGAARVGRDPASVEVAPRLTYCVSADGAVARASVKRYVAHYVALIRPGELDLDPTWLAQVEAALGRSGGWYFDHDRHDDPAIDELISDDLVRRFAVAGTPDECAEQVRAVLDLGFTSVSGNLAAVRRPGNTMAEGLRETIEGFASILPSLR
jgi:5,10-methylenetetrahydromethanopterin reductase